jgi:hypothetical protein
MAKSDVAILSGDNVEENRVLRCQRPPCNVPRHTQEGPHGDLDVHAWTKQTGANERDPIMIVSVFNMPPTAYTRVLLCTLIQSL